jgi:glycerate kinase
LPNGIEKFFKKVLKNAKCARLQGADGRKGNVKSIQMI